MKTANDRPRKIVITSAAAVAQFFGVSRDTVRMDWKARGMPGDHVVGYDLAEITQWREGDRVRHPAADRVVSFYLERYRLAKAKLAELEYNEECSLVVDRAAC